MKDLDIDGYNATFDHLVQLAGYQRDEKGTLEKYRQGLLRRVGFRVYDRFDRDKRPLTLDAWQAAAREEVLQMIDKEADFGPNPFAQKKQKGGWKPSGPKGNGPKRDPNAMDVDNLQSQPTKRPNSLTPEERDTLRKEGRCFFCRKVASHIAKYCPEK